MEDIIDKYYREAEKRRGDNVENPNRIASLARDTNNTIRKLKLV
jgi:hypothetical protein